MRSACLSACIVHRCMFCAYVVHVLFPNIIILTHPHVLWDACNMHEWLNWESMLCSLQGARKVYHSHKYDAYHMCKQASSKRHVTQWRAYRGGESFPGRRAIGAHFRARTFFARQLFNKEENMVHLQFWEFRFSAVSAVAIGHFTSYVTSNFEPPKDLIPYLALYGLKMGPLFYEPPKLRARPAHIVTPLHFTRIQEPRPWPL